MTTERGVKKKLKGIVVSDRMDKTVVVSVERLTKHRTYEKFMRRHAKYLAHDPKNRCGVGDTVRIIECRPLSKNKRWLVFDVIKKAAALGE